MSYRNELAAAQSRGNALERELSETRRQLEAHGNHSSSSAWSRLVDRGVHEERRFREAADRRHAKSEKEARKRLLAERRSARRLALFHRFDQSRRALRSNTRWGAYGHWFFPVVATSPLLCAFVLFILVPKTLWILLGWFVLSCAIWGFANLWAMAMRPREAARIEALPFELRGHSQTMGDEFNKLKVSLRFEGSAPTIPQMQRWIYGLATEVRGRTRRALVRNTKVERNRSWTMLHASDLDTRWMAGNRSYHQWYKVVIEKALVDLHQSFPLISVDVRGHR